MMLESQNAAFRQFIKAQFLDYSVQINRGQRAVPPSRLHHSVIRYLLSKVIHVIWTNFQQDGWYNNNLVWLNRIQLLSLVNMICHTSHYSIMWPTPTKPVVSCQKIIDIQANKPFYKSTDKRHIQEQYWFFMGETEQIWQVINHFRA